MKKRLRKKIFKRDILPNIEAVDKSIPRKDVENIVMKNIKVFEDILNNTEKYKKKETQELIEQMFLYKWHKNEKNLN
jgi:hypothetical protein